MRLLKEIKLIYASEDYELLKIFNDCGFNVKNDLGKLKINEKGKNYIIEEIFHDIQEEKQITILYKFNEISILKFRIKNLNNNRGKSNGYRVLVLLVSYEGVGLIFHIYNHNQKSNISGSEKNSLKKIVNEFSK